MTGLISKTKNIHNLTLEDQCLKMLTQIVLSQAMFTMTGLISKTVNTHNQISEDQCHKMLIQTALSQATFTMTGLTFNKKIQNPQIQMTHNQMKKMFNYKVLI
jgi:methionine-rich copper-binding protein CopC